MENRGGEVCKNSLRQSSKQGGGDAPHLRSEVAVSKCGCFWLCGCVLFITTRANRIKFHAPDPRCFDHDALAFSDELYRGTCFVVEKIF